MKYHSTEDQLCGKKETYANIFNHNGKRDRSKNDSQITVNRDDSFSKSVSCFRMDRVLEVKAIRRPFIDDNSSGTSGDQLNQHIKHAVPLSNLYQPL